MAIKVILFGQLIEETGKNILEVEEAGDTDLLVQKLHQCYPKLGTVCYRIAVDKKLVAENTPLSEGMTVALLPPFSGG